MPSHSPTAQKKNNELRKKSVLKKARSVKADTARRDRTVVKAIMAPKISQKQGLIVKKTVRWSDNLVSGVRYISKLSKEDICGTPGIDDYYYFAKLDRKSEQKKREKKKQETKTKEDAKWLSRTLTLDDFG